MLALAPATASIPVPPFGTLFLDPSTMVSLPSLALSRPSGLASVSFTVPNAPSIVGVSVYGQGLIVHPPAMARLTNLTADAVFRSLRVQELPRFDRPG